jgi:PhnB protein
MPRTDRWWLGYRWGKRNFGLRMSLEHCNFSPESLGGGTVRMVMVVEDPDAAFARAVTAGANVVWPVGNQYGWRLGRIVDPFGHHWEIGKPLADNA